MADPTWAPAEQTATDATGKKVALINGAWVPVQATARDAAGKVMALGDFAAIKSEGQVIKSPREQFVPSGERVTQAPPTGIESLGRGMSDVTQGLKQRALEATDSKAAETYTADKTQELQLYQQGLAAGDSGFDPARLSGGLMFTSPAFAVPGGAAAGMPARMASNAGAGGLAAGAMFAPEGTSALDNAMTGAGIGAAIPPAFALTGKALRTGYHGLIEPTLKSGQTAIKGRAYLESAGDKADEIIRLLTDRKKHQLVPGSMPTAAEAASPAGRAEFSALGAGAAKAKPSNYLQRADEQNAARIAAVDDFAGNPAKRAAAVEAREARTQPHYEKGEAQVSDTSGLNVLMERPSSKAVLARAERGLAEKDKEFAPLFPNGLPRQMTGEEAQRMKLAFDDMIKLQPKSGADTAELRDITQTRADFIAWMEKSFPSLGTGRKLYKTTSGPVNQMDVGTELREKLVPALREEGKQKAGVFSQAVRDSAGVLKDATGQPRFKELQDVLTGRQLAKVHGVQDDLARADRNAEMARRGTEAAPDALSLATGNLEREIGGKPVNMLNRGVMIANAIIGRLEGKVNKKLAAEMAVEMLNPPKVGEALVAAQHRAARNKAMSEAILQMQQRPLAVGAGTSQGAQ